MVGRAHQSIPNLDPTYETKAEAVAIPNCAKSGNTGCQTISFRSSQEPVMKHVHHPAPRFIGVEAVIP